MNVLPILALIFMLLKDKFDLQSLIKNIDLQSLSPILELFNVDASILNALNGDAFKEILNGNFDLKTLLPLIMPLLTSFLKPNSAPFNANNFSPSFQDFSIIKDIAGQDVTQAFESYFE